ncbi:TusE/DsrC/DsvC family sulfur relay protein [Chloroflexota bacterium]
MPKGTFGGIEIEIDEDGFIQEPDKWNKEVAEDVGKIEAALAPGEDHMSEDHWKIVDYLRDYYLQFEIAPPIRMVTRKTGIDLRKIYELFPKGPAAGACKVAGLPKPTGCV